jgi:hypothetical protein
MTDEHVVRAEIETSIGRLGVRAWLRVENGATVENDHGMIAGQARATIPDWVLRYGMNVSRLAEFFAMNQPERIWKRLRAVEITHGDLGAVYYPNSEENDDR